MVEMRLDLARLEGAAARHDAQRRNRTAMGGVYVPRGALGAGMALSAMVLNGSVTERFNWAMQLKTD